MITDYTFALVVKTTLLLLTYRLLMLVQFNLVMLFSGLVLLEQQAA
jgi:hypothetical protein